MTDTFSIPMRGGHVITVDIDDFDLLHWRWQPIHSPGRNDQIYARRMKCFGSQWKAVLLHVVVLERKLKRPLRIGEVCDHRDGNTLNCRRENLRPATRSQNAHNRRLSSKNTSGATGVCWLPKEQRWKATISVNRRLVYLGSFVNFDDAAYARYEAELKYFGEFSPLLSRQEIS